MLTSGPTAPGVDNGTGAAALRDRLVPPGGPWLLCRHRAGGAGHRHAHHLVDLDRRAAGVPGLVDFAYLYPVLAARAIPYAAWLSRMWYHSGGHGWI